MSRRFILPPTTRMTRKANPSSRSVSRSSVRNHRQSLKVVRGKPKIVADEFSSSQSSDPPTVTISAKIIDKEPRPRRRSQRRPPNPVMTVGLYLLRLGIMGVGIGAIAGTILTVFDPTHFFSSLSALVPSETQKSETENKPNSETEKELETPSAPKATAIPLTQELLPLKQKLDAIATKYPKLQPQAFFIDTDNGAYVSLNGDVPIPAASTIKIPILVAFFQDVDAGKIYLDQKLTMDKDIITSGSGEMQGYPPGKQFTALDVATKMIVISDNTATDMLIRQLGGKEALNQRFKEWGLSATVINNRLPDLEGTNTTSPKDLVMLLAKVNQGELMSLKSRDRLLGIMEKTKTRTLLPQGLEPDAIIAHKTGDIGTVLGDAGVVDITTGKRYIASVIVKRSHNDYAARTLIQEMSRAAYQHFKWYLPRPVVKEVIPPTSPEKEQITARE